MSIAEWVVCSPDSSMEAGVNFIFPYTENKMEIQLRISMVVESR